jgi:hypothetical protein
MLKVFPPKWLRWIDELLSTTTSSVLLNGTAGKEFKYTKGVRLGDPLSPLLYAIAADLLQFVINREFNLGNLLPLFLKELMPPSQLFSMLMAPSSLCKLIRISWPS